MPDWSIKIVPVDTGQPAGPAKFDAPGQTLNCEDGDLVTWNNDTDAEHQPWPTDANYQMLSMNPGDPGYMSNPIPARGSSTPAYPVILTDSSTAQLFYYCCRNHPNERGVISARPL